MTARAERFSSAKVMLANPGLVRVRPDLSLFMARYLRRFRIKRSGRNLLLHSHLPPLDSDAYARFVAQHLVARTPGPSHAQIAITDACPQACACCYNRQRSGERLDTPTIIRVIEELQDMGVCWLGLTGGEPLLSPDLAAITRASAQGCAVKLFTTGMGLSRGRAEQLTDAGLFSVAVSLDHWEPAVHDAGRGFAGAFDAALEAIAVSKGVPGLHVSVSSVFSREMVHDGGIERLLTFLASLDVDEAWLSEVKPTQEAFWRDDLVITEQERRRVADLQDDWNRRPGMTVNYLGHFEGAETFGCNAGCKMVYVDAFGEVSPCVFLPLSFGNVRERPLREIVDEMRASFPGGSRCFINDNFRLLADAGGRLPLGRSRSVELVSRSLRREPAAFQRRLRRRAALPAARRSARASAERDDRGVRTWVRAH